MRKILLFFCLFAFSMPLWADDNGKFTSVAVRFISRNRTVNVCEQLTDNMISIETKKGDTRKVLCIWSPYLDEGVCYLNAEDEKRLRNVDFLLLGYGQTPANPAFRWWIPTSKVTRKLKMEKLNKYKMSRSLNDFQF